jgi:hypothetical protein
VLFGNEEDLTLGRVRVRAAIEPLAWDRLPALVPLGASAFAGG